MYSFEEYIREGEPNKANKAKAWKTAIGLQKVDGLDTSEYLISTAKQNIEGDITIEDAKQQINNYYSNLPQKDDKKTEEADKVSVRITEILSNNAFSFSPVEYISIHRKLFSGIYDFAGELRSFNISKKEWILNGESVLYANFESLKNSLEYDIQQEKVFNYSYLNKTEIIEHLAEFLSNLWQIHAFAEGNTRTTAVFFIKYLQQLGFKDVNNNLFAENSWYFRNALVRANYQNLNKGIHKTNKYILKFLSNLINKTDFVLKNIDLHIDNQE
ncbi:MAG: cell filamentation protein Fic [Bacteroidales bacterium]|nr:cell filamentation protein Fic [Bacteroidales bacterium]